MLMKHNISEFKCGKCNMLFMHLNDFIKHDQVTHNSTVFIGNRKEKETFECPLCDFKDSYMPVVRQHIVDEHSRMVILDESENGIDDPKPPNEVEKYPKRIIIDNAQSVKIGKRGILSKREVEKDNDDLGRRGIQNKKAEFKTHMAASHGMSEKSQFSCNFCKLKLKTAIMLKNHIMRIHVLKNETPSYKVYYMK